MEKQRSKMSRIHIGMFALSFISEINTIRLQYKEGDRKLVYLSSTLSQLELLWELYFGHLNESVEPLIYFFEAIKSILKFGEYIKLITKAKMSWYVSKELYLAHIKEVEKRNSTLNLPRSKKNVTIPDKFPISNKLVKYALKNVNSTDSLQSIDGENLVSRSRLNGTSIILQEMEHNEEKKQLFNSFKNYVTKKFSSFKRLAKSRKLKIIELLLILRPVLYMYSLLKWQQDSYIPYLISLIIEWLGIYIGYKEIDHWKTETEKAELKGRFKGLFKYALKEPVYSKFTVKIVYLLLHRFISDSKIGYLIGILSYFKYYCYIV